MMGYPKEPPNPSFAANLKFADFKGLLAGQDGIVVACGPSASKPENAARYGSYWTLACNRAINISPPHDFSLIVEQARNPVWHETVRNAPMFNFGFHHAPRSVQIKDLDMRRWLEFLTPPKPARLAQSTYYAIGVMLHLGCSRIGVVGLDLCPRRYHKRAMPVIEDKYKELVKAVHRKTDQTLFNLNPGTSLKAIPVGEWSWLREKNGPDPEAKPDIRR